SLSIFIKETTIKFYKGYSKTGKHTQLQVNNKPAIQSKKKKNQQLNLNPWQYSSKQQTTARLAPGERDEPYPRNTWLLCCAYLNPWRTEQDSTKVERVRHGNGIAARHPITRRKPLPLS
uniref:Uncharacterized protein n=1 Tax=Aegilops tauschii subsp. strangulata TaxID=200361 RepID=A0A453CHD2_AEGTS